MGPQLHTSSPGGQKLPYPKTQRSPQGSQLKTTTCWREEMIWGFSQRWHLQPPPKWRGPKREGATGKKRSPNCTSYRAPSL